MNDAILLKYTKAIQSATEDFELAVREAESKMLAEWQSVSDLFLGTETKEPSAPDPDLQSAVNRIKTELDEIAEAGQGGPS